MIRLFTMLAVSATICGLSSTAQAHVNPEDVAARCVDRVESLVDRYQDVTADKGQECLATIRRLLAAGRKEAAIHAGRRCIEASRQRADDVLTDTRSLCAECIEYLRTVGAYRLAARVQNACEDAALIMGATQDRLESIIDTALE